MLLKSSMLKVKFLKIFLKKPKIQIMKKYLLTISLMVFLSAYLNAQTVADFTFSTVCFGDSMTLSSTATSTATILQTNWDIDSNGIFTEATTSSVKWLFPLEKNYVVGLQVITNIDTAVIYKTVSMFAKPVADFNIDFPRQCLSNFFTFTNLSVIASGTMSYFWDMGDGATYAYSKDTVNIYPATVATYNVKMIVTSDNGCKDSITKKVEVVDSSEADFSINDTDQCLVGNSFIFTNTSLLCDPLINFSWDLNGDGIYGDSANVDPLTHVITTPGTYKIGLKVETTVSADSIQKTIIVYPSPAASFTITSDSGQCLSGNSFTFNNTSVLGGPGSMTYLWSTGDGSSSTDPAPLPYTYSTTGSFMVKLVVTSDKGCKDSTDLTARIYDQPNVSFTVSDTIDCYLNAFNFTNTSTIATPWNLTYFWDFDDGSNSTAVNPSQTYSAAATYQVKLIATSDSNCQDSFIQTIYAISNTKARFDIDNDTQCFNGNMFLFTDKHVTCNTLQSTLWDLDNDGAFDDASLANVAHSFPAAGTYTVGYKVVTNTDSDSVYVNVVVLTSPVADFTVNDSTQMFTGNNFIFTNNSTPLGSIGYFWEFGDGNLSAVKDPTHTYATTGTFPVKLTVFHMNNCTDSIIQNMYVFSPIEAGFIAASVCFGDSTTFIDTTVSGSPITSVGWDIDNDLIPDIFGDTVKYLFSTPGTYSVGLFVNSTTSADTLYKNVIVNATPVADFSFNEACQGSVTSFTDATSSADPIAKYYWDFDNNGSIDDSSGANPTRIFPSAGTNLVKLTVFTVMGCSSEIIRGVKVNNQPNADFAFNNVCEGDSTNFINNTTIVTDTVINLLWQYGDGNDGIILKNHAHLYLTSGVYNVRLIALTNKGCKDTITKPVTIYAKPALNLTFSGPTTFYDGYNVKIKANGVFDSTIWSNGDTTAEITVTKTGVYSVIVTDSNGCSSSDSASVMVIVVDEFTAVDVITPNGDNINDLWIIKDVGYFSPVEVSIYNRYGDLLYSSADYKNDWDGTRNGENLPEGAYYYIVRTKQGGIYKGTLNIIR